MVSYISYREALEKAPVLIAAGDTEVNLGAYPEWKDWYLPWDRVVNVFQYGGNLGFQAYDGGLLFVWRAKLVNWDTKTTDHGSALPQIDTALIYDVLQKLPKGDALKEALTLIQDEILLLVTDGIYELERRIRDVRTDVSNIRDTVTDLLNG